MTVSVAFRRMVGSQIPVAVRSRCDFGRNAPIASPGAAARATKHKTRPGARQGRAYMPCQSRDQGCRATPRSGVKISDGEITDREITRSRDHPIARSGARSRPDREITYH
eukprot:11191313-Lingulodinium_polyedra.AAC.1